MKTCTKCGELKELSEFSKRKRSKDGLRSTCKVCDKEAKDAYRKTSKYKKTIDAYRDKAKENHKRFRSTDHGKKSIRDYEKRYLETEIGKEYRKRRDERSRKNHPQEYKARKAIDYAIRHKGLFKPTTCSLCGLEQPVSKIHGHHWSYLEEHWLDVVWCCTQCHSDIHNNKISDILNRQ